MKLTEMLSACIFVHIGYHLWICSVVTELVKNCQIQIVLWGANV